MDIVLWKVLYIKCFSKFGLLSAQGVFLKRWHAKALMMIIYFISTFKIHQTTKQDIKRERLITHLKKPSKMLILVVMKAFTQYLHTSIPHYAYLSIWVSSTDIANGPRQHCCRKSRIYRCRTAPCQRNQFRFHCCAMVAKKCPRLWDCWERTHNKTHVSRLYLVYFVFSCEPRQLKNTYDTHRQAQLHHLAAK